MMNPINALCSRDQCHEGMHVLLENYLDLFASGSASWEKLIYEAEEQGIAPLLYKHIRSSGYIIPGPARRLLQSLYLRHKRSQGIRNRAIAEILTVFHTYSIDCLLLKGIVLSNTVYREPGSRPMRDIDLLCREQDVITVRDLLLGLGFCTTKDPAIGPDHHHVEPLVKTIEGLPLAIELHRKLLPGESDDKRWSYETLRERSVSFQINGIQARTLSLEHTLYYLYLHGLRAPLTYEPFRLIHVADLVSFVELNYKRINWRSLQADFHAVHGVLSRLHFLTPWHPAIISGLSLDVTDEPGGAGLPYRGWPLFTFERVPVHQWFNHLKNTIWPSQWWTQLYYGQIKGPGYYKARFFTHPQTLWRLIKTFSGTAKI